MTDEIQMFRAARPEVVPYDPVSRTRARALLLDAPGPRRSRWTITASIATAGALAAGLLLLGETESTVSEPSVRPVSAVEYLEKAARVVERQQDVRPEPHEWLYEKVYLKDSDGAMDQVSESWKRFDGRLAASLNGPDREIVIDEQHPGKDDRTPLQRYDRLRTFPTDPDGLLSWAYAAADADRDEPNRALGGLLPERTPDLRHQDAFFKLGGLFDDVLAPPWLRAAVFRAIAKVPDVQVLPESTDLLGRPVATVARMNEYGLRHEILLDRETYAGRGYVSVVVRDDLKRHPEKVILGPDGKATSFPALVRPIGDSHYELREATGVVSRAGQRVP